MRYSILIKTPKLNRLVISYKDSPTLIQGIYFYADWIKSNKNIIKYGFLIPRFKGKYIVPKNLIYKILIRSMNDIGIDYSIKFDEPIPNNILELYKTIKYSDPIYLNLDAVMNKMLLSGYDDRDIYDFELYQKYASNDRKLYYGDRLIDSDTYFFNNGEIERKIYIMKGERKRYKVSHFIKILNIRILYIFLFPISIYNLFNSEYIRDKKLIFESVYKCKIQILYISGSYALPIDIPMIFDNYFNLGLFIIIPESDDKNLTFIFNIYELITDRKNKKYFHDIFSEKIPKTQEELTITLKKFIKKHLDLSFPRYELILLTLMKNNFN